MRAGKLDRLIDLQSKTATESPSGEVTEVWSTFCARKPASYAPVRADERYAAPQTVARQQVEFRIRYSSNVAGLSPQHRVIYPAMNDGDDAPANPEDARIYDILEVHELGRRDGLRIITQRRVDVPSS